MLYQARNILSVARGHVPQYPPLVCTNPRPDLLHRLNPNRVRRTVTQFEADVLAAGVTLDCTCGHAMRRVQHPAGCKLQPKAVSR